MNKVTVNDNEYVIETEVDHEKTRIYHRYGADKKQGPYIEYVAGNGADPIRRKYYAVRLYDTITAKEALKLIKKLMMVKGILHQDQQFLVLELVNQVSLNKNRNKAKKKHKKILSKMKKADK